MAGGRIDVEIAPDLSGFDDKLAAGLRRSGGALSGVAKGLGLAIAAGAAVGVVGLKKAIDIGIDYQNSLNDLQAVTRATSAQMAKVGQVAKDLGADMTLPATSAADAASAMTELAKGGLSVSDAMTAAKGTLQLAAAAQVSAAQAAEIQSNSLNEFGLSADKAGHVADVLANTANAASGSITDMAEALKFVGPAARGMGADIDSTATAIGLLANNGIRGSEAGTSLRGILASLSSPSKQAQKALKELGVQAFDQQGKFVGLRTITDQLAKAKGRLSDADFAAASSIAFGNEGFTVANALANSGAKAFDDMATAVGHAGGAAEVAQAKTKGLGGAIEGFKSQLETTSIGVFEKLSPTLEGITRAGADFVAKATPSIVNGVQRIIDTGTGFEKAFGPAIVKGISDKVGEVETAVNKLVGPVEKGFGETLNSAVNLGIVTFGGFADVVKRGVDEAEPLAHAIGDIAEGINKAGGPIGALKTGLELAFDVVEGVVVVVGPFVGLVADLVGEFGDLPGPIQSVAIALLALKFGGPILSGLKNAISGTAREADGAGRNVGLLGRAFSTALAPVRLVANGLGSVTGTIREFAGEVQVQRSLGALTEHIGNIGAGAATSGRQVGILSGAVAAFNTSAIPAVTAARNFRDQTLAIRDGAAAAGAPISTLGAAFGTLVERSSTLSQMRTAFQEASEGATRFSTAAGVAAAAGTGLRSAAGGLVSALGGPWGIAIAGATLGLGILAERNADAARAEAQQKAAVNDLAAALRGAGKDAETVARQKVGERLTGEFSDAAQSAKGFGISLQDIVDSAVAGKPVTSDFAAQIQHLQEVARRGPFDEEGKKALALLGAINQLNHGYSNAITQNQDLAAAIAGGGKGGVNGATAAAAISTDKFSRAMGVLVGSASDADSRVRALKDALDALSGGQTDLEGAQAKLNEELDNLGKLFSDDDLKAKGFSDSLVTADGHFNIATENGRKFRDALKDIAGSAVETAQRTFDVTGSIDQSKDVIQKARDNIADLAKKFGLSADQAAILADQLGLIPHDVAVLIKSPGMTETQVQLDNLKDKLKGLPPNTPVTVNALTADAEKKLTDMGFQVTHLPTGQFTVVAQTETANDELQGFVKRWNGFTIRLNAQIRGGVGGNLVAQLGAARGYIVERYAQGGIKPLTPMRTGIAAMVPPNTWRVVGDRMRDDEAYIPVNQSNRSVALLHETASRMGFDLLRRFAAGGMAVKAPVSAGFSGQTLNGLSISGRLRMDADGFGTLVDARISHALTGEAREVYLRRGRS